MPLPRHPDDGPESWAFNSADSFDSSDSFRLNVPVEKAYTEPEINFIRMEIQT
jgi:hypothetical protein